MKEIIIGSSAEEQTTVSKEITAASAGSGSLDVFATPFMIALMEKATCTAIEPFLENGETTVGTKICVSHDRASVIGEVITARAEISEAQGRKTVFSVTAINERGEAIGSGTIERFTVLSEKFIQKAQQQAEG